MKTALLCGHLPLRVSLLLLTGFTSIVLAKPLDQTQERARIEQERAQVQLQSQQAEQNCFKRLVITPCIDKAQRVRRDLLNQLKQEEILLDEARRKQRAAERLQQIEEKADPKSLDVLPSPNFQIRPADLAAPVGERSPPANEPSSSSMQHTAKAQHKNSRAEAEKSAAQAARRAQAQREKLQAHERRRAEAERRMREKAQSSKPASAGLPLPASASSAASAASAAPSTSTSSH